jgi:hypothetical protein
METATQTLHRLTAFEAGPDWTHPVDDPRVVRDFEPMDMSQFPWFFKRYAHSLPRVALPRDLPSTTAPAVVVLAGTAEIARAELDLPHLSRLLHLSAGVVRTKEPRHGTWLFRAAGSAGGRFPLEVYVAVPDGMRVPAGVHWYHPQDHALLHVGPPPPGDAPALIVTGIPWRTGWKYRERGYRHVYWDAGTMLSQVLAVADSAGLTPSLYTRFPDAAVAALVGADGVHEWPVAVVALGAAGPGLEATGQAAAGEVDAAPIEFPLVTAAQRAGDQDNFGCRGIAGPGSTSRWRKASRSRSSRWRAARSAAWIGLAASRRTCSGRASPLRYAASLSLITSSCTTSRAYRRASTAGRTSRLPYAPGRCETSSTGSASQDSHATPHSW